MTKTKEIMGKLISANRAKKNITQQELATLLNVDRQYIWRIENGRVNLTMDYFDKVRKALDCTLLDFQLATLPVSTIESQIK